MRKIKKKNVKLDFGKFVLDADIFNNIISENFLKNLPYKIKLTQWGNEIYGSINMDLGEDNPFSKIPEGGIAYTNNGNFICIFFGQQPAWPVEYIGQIKNDQWKKLINSQLDNLKIYLEN